MIHKNGVRKFGSRDAPSRHPAIVSARVASALVVRVERFAVHFGGESPAPKALKERMLGTHHRGRPDAPDLAQHVLCQALQVVMVAVKVRQGLNQRFIALDRFGSVPPCGGAERTSTFLRSECRLRPLLSDRIVAAATVGCPPFAQPPRKQKSVELPANLLLQPLRSLRYPDHLRACRRRSAPHGRRRLHHPAPDRFTRRECPDPRPALHA
jgi:hypothetical protein